MDIHYPSSYGNETFEIRVYLAQHQASLRLFLSPSLPEYFDVDGRSEGLYMNIPTVAYIFTLGSVPFGMEFYF